MKVHVGIVVTAILCIVGAAGDAIAFPIAAAGTECFPVIVGGNDPVVATYQGNSAAYSNDLYLMLDGSGQPGDDGNPANDRFIFNNHTSPVGSTVNLGSFPIGSELIFRLHVNNTGYDYQTGPAGRNPDGSCHARAQANWSPGETLVSFEDLFGGPFAYNDLSFSFTNTTTSPYDVFVGYADNLRPSAFFPTPFFGDPTVDLFAGQNPNLFELDAGAFRIQNTGPVDIAINSVSVRLKPALGGPTFTIWSGFLPFTLHPGKDAVFTQTTQFNFDTSEFAFVPQNLTDNCSVGPLSTTALCVDNAPILDIDVDGTLTHYRDCRHILDTGGFDAACCLPHGNESLQWRLLCTSGIDNPGGLCGNGTVDPGEECDDGNTTGGDGCSASCQAENEPPEAHAGLDQLVECASPSGTRVTVDGSGSSDPDGDSFTCHWTSATCAFDDSTSCLTAATCPLGQNTATLVVNDGTVDSPPDEVAIVVQDSTPPLVTAASANPLALWPPNHTMRDVTVGYTATDTCSATTCTLSVTSNEPDNGTGDGDTVPDWIVLDDHRLQLRAERAGNGIGRTYTTTISCSDSSRNPATGGATVIVKHDMSSPRSGSAFRIGSAVSFAGGFWDVPGKTHTGQWVFDNITTPGTIAEPTATKPGSVRGTYTFNATGVYAVKMNVTDTAGAKGTADAVDGLNALVVIYDPNGGYVTGGGWIDSPAGALAANPSLTGKVSFGFESKYFKNATNPKGETEFDFRLANFKFNALNFDYLVISGARAQYKGLGKVNGDGGYAFILTVIDGQATGGGGVDKFRIKIWNKTTGAIVYDNQTGAHDNADPITPAGTGSSIVIQP